MTNTTPIDETYQERHLTPPELAARLQLHVVTLATWRMKGLGPKFVKTGGRVRYPLVQVEAWEQSRLRQNTAVV